MSQISELQKKFYEIADNCSDRWEIGAALGIVDIINMPCSPDGYDAVIAYKIEQIANRLRNPDFKAWANEIIAAALANADNPQDLRGMKKNTHIVL